MQLSAASTVEYVCGQFVQYFDHIPPRANWALEPYAYDCIPYACGSCLHYTFSKCSYRVFCKLLLMHHDYFNLTYAEICCSQHCAGAKDNYWVYTTAQHTTRLSADFSVEFAATAKFFDALANCLSIQLPVLLHAPFCSDTPTLSLSVIVFQDDVFSTAMRVLKAFGNDTELLNCLTLCWANSGLQKLWCCVWLFTQQTPPDTAVPDATDLCNLASAKHVRTVLKRACAKQTTGMTLAYVLKYKQTAAIQHLVQKHAQLACRHGQTHVDPDNNPISANLKQCKHLLFKKSPPDLLRWPLVHVYRTHSPLIHRLAIIHAGLGSKYSEREQEGMYCQTNFDNYWPLSIK